MVKRKIDDHNIIQNTKLPVLSKINIPQKTFIIKFVVDVDEISLHGGTFSD